MIRWALAVAGLGVATATLPPVPAVAQTPAPAEAQLQEARWTVTLRHGNTDWFSEDVWLLHGPERSVTLIVVGGAERILRGRVARDGSIELRGEDESERLRLTLTPTADGRMTGRWGLGLGGGTATAAPSAPEIAAADFGMVFDRVHTMLAERFMDPRFNGQDWAALGTRYRALAVAAPNEGVFIDTVRAMLRELRTSHLGFFRQPPPPPAAATPQPQRQIVGWTWPEPGIGYLRIARFSGLPQWREVLDRGFAELADTDTLIVDLRENGGGNLSLGMRLADHLFPNRRSLGLYTSRVGLVQAGVTSIDDFPRERAFVYDGYEQDEFIDALLTRGAVSLEAGGRAYTRARRVYVLTDRVTGSAAESVAAGLKEEGAIIVGGRTAGAMLVSVREEIIPGWTLRFPAGDYRTQRGAVVEGVGVEPTIAVNPREAYEEALRLARRAQRDGQ